MIDDNDGVLEKATNAVEITNKEDIELIVLEKKTEYHQNYNDFAKTYLTMMSYVNIKFEVGNTNQINAGAKLEYNQKVASFSIAKMDK